MAESCIVFPNLLYIDHRGCGRVHRVARDLLTALQRRFCLGPCGESGFLTFIQENEAEIIRRFNEALLDAREYPGSMNCLCVLDSAFALDIRQPWGEVVFGFPASRSYALSILALALLVKTAARWNEVGERPLSISAILIDGEYLDDFELERLTRALRCCWQFEVYGTAREGIVIYAS